MFVKAARAGLALGAITAATAHTLVTELMPISPSFLRENVIEPHKRLQILLTVAIATFATVAVSFVAYLRNRERAWLGLSWWARLTCPLLVMPLAAPLFRRDFGDTVQVTLVLAIVVILAERLCRVSLEALASRPAVPSSSGPSWLDRLFERQRLWLGVVIALAAAHGLFMCLFAVWSHQRFGTFGYDLGQYEAIFANTLAGRPLRVPALGWDYDWGELNGHADLGTFYMLPIYALYPHAATLLVMQSTLVASAAIPIFILARRNIGTGWGVLFAIAWLGYPPLHGAQLYDVHMQPFGMSWVLWAVAAADARRYIAYWIFVVLALLCREDVSIGLCMFGALLFFSRHRTRTGLATALVAGTYFLVLRFFIMSRHSTFTFAEVYKELYPVGESGYGAVLKTMTSNPAFYLRSLLTWEKVRYVLQLFAPLAFLPLRRPWLLVFFVPGLVLTLSTTAYAPTIAISFQYICNWAGYAFVAAIVVLSLYGSDAVGTQKRLAAAVALSLGILLSNQQWGAWTPSPVVRGGFVDVAFLPPTKADLDRDDDLQALMKLVPGDAKLCSADRTQPHVSWHIHNWSLKDGLYQCEYLIFTDVPGDLGSDRGAQQIATGAFTVVKSQRGVTLAKKAAAPPPAR